MDTLVKLPFIFALVLCLVRSTIAQNATSNISVPCFELSASQYCKGFSNRKRLFPVNATHVLQFFFLEKFWPKVFGSNNGVFATNSADFDIVYAKYVLGNKYEVLNSEVGDLSCDLSKAPIRWYNTNNCHYLVMYGHQICTNSTAIFSPFDACCDPVYTYYDDFMQAIKANPSCDQSALEKIVNHQKNITTYAPTTNCVNGNENDEYCGYNVKENACARNCTDPALVCTDAAKSSPSGSSSSSSGPLSPAIIAVISVAGVAILAFSVFMYRREKRNKEETMNPGGRKSDIGTQGHVSLQSIMAQQQNHGPNGNFLGDQFRPISITNTEGFRPLSLPPDMIPPMSPLSNGPDTYSPVANSQYQRSPPMHPLLSGSPIGANQYQNQSQPPQNTQTDTFIASTTPQIPSSPTTQFQPTSSIQSSIFSPPQQVQVQSQHLAVQQSPNSPPLNSQSQLYANLPPLPPSPASPTSLTFPSPPLSTSSPANTPMSPPSPISETTRTAFNTYVPCLPDEIHVQSGNQVAIEFIYEDGWASGVNLATGETGVFPLSCFVGMDVATDGAKTEGRNGFDQHERLARTVSLNRNLGA